MQIDVVRCRDNGIVNHLTTLETTSCDNLTTLVSFLSDQQCKLWISRLCLSNLDSHSSWPTVHNNTVGRLESNVSEGGSHWVRCEEGLMLRRYSVKFCRGIVLFIMQDVLILDQPAS